MDCSVQAGITRLALNSELRHTGLRFPVDPGADASLGGMAACGASGTSAVRCGTMRENTLGLTAVLASGEVITTGGRARKSSAGYDLTRLLIGSCARMTWSSNPRPAAALERQTRRETGQAWLHATCDPPVLPHPGPVPPSIPPCVWHREGTLGVITELTLRLQAVPPAAAAAVCTFPSLSAAASAVALVLQVMIPPPRHDPCGGMAASASLATTHGPGIWSSGPPPHSRVPPPGGRARVPCRSARCPCRAARSSTPPPSPRSTPTRARCVCRFASPSPSPLFASSSSGPRSPLPSVRDAPCNAPMRLRGFWYPDESAYDHREHTRQLSFLFCVGTRSRRRADADVRV